MSLFQSFYQFCFILLILLDAHIQTWDGYSSSLCHISYQKNALRPLTSVLSTSTPPAGECVLPRVCGFSQLLL